MKLFKKKNKSPEYWWKELQRVRGEQLLYRGDSREYSKLNKIGWELVEKYIDTLAEELKNERQ